MVETMMIKAIEIIPASGGLMLFSSLQYPRYLL